jgi:hypothetical protein
MSPWETLFIPTTTRIVAEGFEAIGVAGIVHYIVVR